MCAPVLIFFVSSFRGVCPETFCHLANSLSDPSVSAPYRNPNPTLRTAVPKNPNSVPCAPLSRQSRICLQPTTTITIMRPLVVAMERWRWANEATRLHPAKTIAAVVHDEAHCHRRMTGIWTSHPRAQRTVRGSNRGLPRPRRRDRRRSVNCPRCRNYHAAPTYARDWTRTLMSAAVGSRAIECVRVNIRRRTEVLEWEVKIIWFVCAKLCWSSYVFLGWERHYTGLSDSDLTTHAQDSRSRPRHSLSPDKDFMGDFGDSDMESVVSVTSSAFSTQSERPRGSRGLRWDAHLPSILGRRLIDYFLNKENCNKRAYRDIMKESRIWCLPWVRFLGESRLRKI